MLESRGAGGSLGRRALVRGGYESHLGEFNGYPFFPLPAFILPAIAFTLYFVKEKEWKLTFSSMKASRSPTTPETPTGSAGYRMETLAIGIEIYGRRTALSMDGLLKRLAKKGGNA